MKIKHDKSARKSLVTMFSPTIVHVSHLPNFSATRDNLRPSSQKHASRKRNDFLAQKSDEGLSETEGEAGPDQTRMHHRMGRKRDFGKESKSEATERRNLQYSAACSGSRG